VVVKKGDDTRGVPVSHCLFAILGGLPFFFFFFFFFLFLFSSFFFFFFFFYFIFIYLFIFFLYSFLFWKEELCVCCPSIEEAYPLLLLFGIFWLFYIPRKGSKNLDPIY